MSYNKRTWATGNVVGAVDLNRMEQGIEDASGGGAEPLIVRPSSLTVNGSQITLTLDKSYADVLEAMEEGRPCFIGFAYEGESWLCQVNDIHDISYATLPIIFVSIFESEIAFMYLDSNTGYFTSQVFQPATTDEPLKLYATGGGPM